MNFSQREDLINFCTLPGILGCLRPEQNIALQESDEWVLLAEKVVILKGLHSLNADLEHAQFI